MESTETSTSHHRWHRFGQLWDVFVVLACVWIAIVAPLHLAFFDAPSNFLLPMELATTPILILDAIFLLPIFEAFATGLQGWVAWTLFALIPLLPLSHLHVPVIASLFLKATVFLPLLKLKRGLSLLSHRLNHNATPRVRITTFVMLVLLTAHGVACFWLVLRGVDAKFSLPLNYMRAFYWSVTTLATIGYGDITPDQNSIVQMIFAVTVMLLGVGMYGYIVGNIANLLANMDVARAKYLEKMEKVNAFFGYRNIPPRMQDRIRSYYRYTWENRSGFNEQDVIDDLPLGLKKQIAIFLNRDILEKVSLFKGADLSMIEDLALSMQAEVVMPGDYVFRHGEIGDKMFFINKGSISILSQDEKTVYATLNEGQFFGEAALLLSQPRNASAKAVTYADLYTLNKESLERVLLRYPKFADHVHQQMNERMAPKAS